MNIPDIPAAAAAKVGIYNINNIDMFVFSTYLYRIWRFEN